MGIFYIPKSLSNTMCSAVITDIYFCGYAPTGVSGPLDPNNSINSKMTNHWVLYLTVSPTRSIRFDPSPTGQNNSLDLLVTSKNCTRTVNAVKEAHFTPAHGLTVGNVIDHILSHNYHQYQFNPNGQGCRYWAYSVANLLRSAQYIVSDAEVEAATESLQAVWNLGGERASASQQTAIAQGTFF